MFFFILAYVTASEYQADPLAGGGEMIYKRGTLPKASTSADLDSVRKPNNDANDANDANGGDNSNNANVPRIASGSNGVSGTNGVIGANGAHGVDGARPAETSAEKQIQPQISASTHLSDPPTKPFIWENVSYEVPVKGGKRKLLNDVSGFVRPGTMTALMGESGAGKTTLLNVLARRTDTGVVTGEFSVGGQVLPVSFQAETGYVQQQDTVGLGRKSGCGSESLGVLTPPASPLDHRPRGARVLRHTPSAPHHPQSRQARVR
jgi:ATP-binding cassette subfamily G (WHITE) protein 2 (SNQ2)